jgi:hypothetical protein
LLAQRHRLFAGTNVKLRANPAERARNEAQAGAARSTRRPSGHARRFRLAPRPSDALAVVVRRLQPAFVHRADRHAACSSCSASPSRWILTSRSSVRSRRQSKSVGDASRRACQAATRTVTS